MNKILNVNQAISTARKLHVQNKTIVLVGGVFDILHIGHVLFLEKAKKEGDFLFVLLESDKNTKRKKGEGRPINSQKNRAIVLSGIKFVDYIVLLRGVTKDEDYDKLMIQIKPDVIAMTSSDSQIRRRRAQSKMIGAKLKLVIKKVNGASTSELINEIKN